MKKRGCRASCSCNVVVALFMALSTYTAGFIAEVVRGGIQSVRQGQIDVPLAVNPEGNYRAPPRLETELVYVVYTERGQDMLTPREFAERFGWLNDRELVRLVQAPNAAK